MISEYHSSKNYTVNNEDVGPPINTGASGTAREVDLEQQTKQLSETIEVEDIVSADTNNRLHATDNNVFQSYQTSLKNF